MMSAIKTQAGQVPLFRLRGRTKCGQDLACLAILMFALVPAGVAQQTASAQQTAVQTPANAVLPANNQSPTIPKTPKQKQLADDTAKLLQLANELKAELDKSTKDTLSLGVMKKAEQVEKLAHKVRDEMRSSIGN